jgi:hypothetical protein
MKIFLTVFIVITFPVSSFAQRYVFYLHGKIIEDQGVNAIDTANGYGAYQYKEILDVFREQKFTVISEVRSKNTNPFDYARKMAKQIDSLIKIGVAANNITVIGASKGAIIAMIISSMLKNGQVNFVFMAGCNKDLAEGFSAIKFYGNILSIYEESDSIGRSCMDFRKRPSQKIPHYKEIELHTGLKHGFLYKPLPVWVQPAIKWAGNDYSLAKRFITVTCG